MCHIQPTLYDEGTEVKAFTLGEGLKMCTFLLTKDAIERKMPKALKPQCIIQKYAQLLRV